jgi:hypothetical protein
MPRIPSNGDRPRCQAIAKSGKPCRAPATYDNLTFCRMHTASVSPEELADQRHKGGVAKIPTVLPLAEDPDLSTPQHIRRFIEQTVGLCTRGELSTVIGSFRCFAASVSLKVFELDLIKRVEQIEDLVERWGTRR